MKAIIVKDDTFKTIGFEVTDANNTLFSWGISPTLKSNFQKELILSAGNILVIFELVRISSQIQERNRFHSYFFEVSKLPHADFRKYDRDTDQLVAKMENLIHKLL